MSHQFVNRERELKRLSINANLTKKGEGRTVLIEGPAGIGKTALINKFLEGILSFEVLRGECSVNSKYIAYDLFSRALKGYGNLKEIRDEEERRKARDYAQDLLVRPRMIMVDEFERGAGHFLYKVLRGEVDGVCYTSRFPEEDGIWLTETESDVKSVKPDNLEFSLLPEIIDFLKKGKGGKVVYIDDLNYLIYLNGIGAVMDFLHALYSLVRDKHIIILSGKMEHLTEEEKNGIMNLFDEIVSFHIERKISEPRSFLVDADALKNLGDAAIFSTKRGYTYLVGEGNLTASRLEFELLESIKREIDAGRDVVIDFLHYLIRHHGLRRVYIWLKVVIDYAMKMGRRVYMTTSGLTPFQVDVLSWLVDRSEFKAREYEEIEKKQTIKFYDTILDFLDYNSRKRPILLVLDNLQWADISSLELLKYLARNINNSRIMIIGAYRGDEVANDLNANEVLEDIIEIENTELMRLRPLDINSIENLLSSVEKIKKDDIPVIYQKSGGNPLLALGIARHFREGEFIPETIRESVELELEKVDDRTLKFLKIVAALGNDAELDILKSLMPDASKIFKKVEGKLISIEDSKVYFIHNAYRDIIYEYASSDEKREIHRKLGKVFESRKDMINAAYHYYLAREPKAIELLIHAAEENIRNMAIRNAIEYYEKALEIAKRYRKSESIYRIYERLGDLYQISGDYPRALEMYTLSEKNGNPNKVELSIKIATSYERMGMYEESLQILESHIDDAKGINRAKLLLELGSVKWHLGDFESALKFLSDALHEAEKLNEYEIIADAYRNMAIVKYYTSDYEGAIEFAKQSLEFALKSGNYDLLANSYNVLGVLHSTIGMHDEALHYYKKYLEISQKLGNYDYISKAYNNIFLAYKAKGEYQKGKEYYIKSFEIVLKMGNPRDLALGYNNMAVIEAQDGTYPKALEYMEKSIKYLKDIGDEYTLCTHLINFGNLLGEVAKYDEAEKYLKRALKISSEKGYKLEIVKALCSLITLYADTDRPQLAEKMIGEVEKIFKSGFEDIFGRLSFLFSKIDYFIKRGRLNEAERDAEEALKLAQEINNDAYVMGIKEYMGKIRCEKGDYDTAIRYFEEVIEYRKRTGIKKDIADTYKSYAECLEKIDRSSALKYYRLAREIYRQMEIGNLVDEVDEKIRNLSDAQ